MIIMVPVRWQTKRPTSSIVPTAYALATKNKTQVTYSHMQ